MSAVFKLAIKKKYTQNDLRRLMQEQKSKAKINSSSGLPNVTKIDSPFAKYENGQLMCSLCKSIVRSENVWKVHINSKNHKENIAEAKQFKEKLNNSQNKLLTTGIKRLGSNSTAVVPEKKLKSILRKPTEIISDNNHTNSKTTGEIPNDFFDTKSTFFEATLNKTSIKTDLVNIRRESTLPLENTKMQVDDKDEALPEGFFDDPIKDAKIRNLEYKDPHEEEWEKFQREIKEEATVSNAIIAGEQEEATTERQIEEIDEQIRKWSRVLDLERKKNVVSGKVKDRGSKMDEDSTDTDSDVENDFNEFLDWRSKKFIK